MPTLGLDIDSVELLLALLNADSDLVTEAAGGIFGPPGLGKNFVISKAVAIRSDGGASSSYLPMMSERFLVYCYGATSKGARSVYRAFVNAVHRLYNQRKTLTGGVVAHVRSVEMEAGPVDLVDAATGWTFVWAACRMLFCEEDMA